MTMLQWLGLALFVIGWGPNTYFLFDGIRRYFRGKRHLFLFVLLVVKAVLWFAGIFIGIIGVRVALDLPGLPAGGLTLAWIILSILLLPAYIWSVMRRFET